jgi:hypothetical protein
VNDGIERKDEPVIMGDDLWFNQDQKVAEEMEKLKRKWLENV